MSFFGALTATLISPAVETTTAEGVEVYEVKSINMASDPAVPALILCDRQTEHGQFLKALADQVTDTFKPRVLVSGVVQPTAAERPENDKNSITKGPKITVYAGAIRRIRADLKKDPEQIIIMGSGFCLPVFEMHDKSKRKPQLSVANGNAAHRSVDAGDGA